VPGRGWRRRSAGFRHATKPSDDAGEAVFIADENVAKQRRGNMNRR
jgi:hypothetical protein